MSRTTSANVNRPRVSHDIDTPDDTETASFKAYACQVAKVLRSFGDIGANTRDIHRALGLGNQRRTLTAIAHISGVEQVGILPTRYRLK